MSQLTARRLLAVVGSAAVIILGVDGALLWNAAHDLSADELRGQAPTACDFELGLTGGQRYSGSEWAPISEVGDDSITLQAAGPIEQRAGTWTCIVIDSGGDPLALVSGS